MPLIFITIFILFSLTVSDLQGQTASVLSVSATKDQHNVLPGQIANLAFFVENNSLQSQSGALKTEIPEGWKLISPVPAFNLSAGEKRLFIFTIQVPSNTPIGNFKISVAAIHNESNEVMGLKTTSIMVGEVEKISLQLLNSPDYIKAGEEFNLELLLLNQGNTTKKIFFETRNCRISGAQEVEVQPGESVNISAIGETSQDLMETRKEYFSVRALISGKVTESVFHSVVVFPTGELKIDQYFRFPVTASASYLATNQNGTYEHGRQFELAGKGTLDAEGNHRLEFLARGPNNTNLSFLGIYDQYYVSYENQNLGVFFGEKAFIFTPLTESSRYGLGAESIIKFNNGLDLGVMYVKPRFFSDIKNELALFSGFGFNERNRLELFLISKQLNDRSEPAQLVSLNSVFQPFRRTSLELELSGGRLQEQWDNAFRVNIHSQFSIFNLAGNYYYTGKDYPGYFSNSTFYSGNFSVNLTPRLNAGFYAREDFMNARLDTFFVTAPYSKSLQSMVTYNIATRSHLKFFWREYERKDRLVLDKFHYKTRSANTQFNQKFRNIDYSLLGEYGKTVNYLLEQAENMQTTYRGSANLAYRFNAAHAIRIFGSWSNVNRFVSGEQQNLMAGMSVVSQVAKDFRVNFHLQNAYSIEDYYRNRNLMQLNLDFTPGNKHRFSFRSFYTLFRHQTANPELTFSLSYVYQLGIPLKKVVKAGEVTGRLIRDNGEPAAGVLLLLQNKSTISGKNGEFVFKSVPVGKHLLFVDRSRLAIDELTGIPDPLEVEVYEDQVTKVNLVITKGARLSGMITAEENALSVLRAAELNTQNIVIGIMNDREQYRIVSGPGGNFSFPLLRPGQWTFRIYTNSLPERYMIDEPTWQIELQPGQKKILEIRLMPKKRNIIFKEQGTLMISPRKENPIPGAIHKKDDSTKEITDSVFYSVQVGAFKEKLNPDSGYFADEPYDFEEQNDNLHKYFIGRFSTWQEATGEQIRLQQLFENPFVVKFENNKISPK